MTAIMMLRGVVVGSPTEAGETSQIEQL